jgi:hypothetical protein
VQVIGKDILRFHAAIWPGMLLALKQALPKRIFVHGFINIEGQKMSKSVGNVTAPKAIVDEYGVDAFRYYFLRHISSYGAPEVHSIILLRSGIERPTGLVLNFGDSEKHSCGDCTCSVAICVRPDHITREQLYQDLQDICRARRKTIVFVTHNVREAVCLGDRVVILSPSPGRIREEFRISLPRPRDINSLELAAIAQRITQALKVYLIASQEAVA